MVVNHLPKKMYRESLLPAVWESLNLIVLNAAGVIEDKRLSLEDFKNAERGMVRDILLAALIECEATPKVVGQFNVRNGVDVGSWEPFLKRIEEVEARTGREVDRYQQLCYFTVGSGRRMISSLSAHTNSARPGSENKALRL